MRLSVGSAAFAAAFVLTPVATGYTPAMSQSPTGDFSITNQVESADPNVRDLMRLLQALWEVNAYYPPEAAAADQGGTVKLRLVVSPDGNIFMVTVVQSSGSCALDTAGATTFRDKFVRHFPAGAKELTVDISVHYVLAHRHDQPVAVSDTPVSKRNFTIANDPVKTTVVDTMVQKFCTGVAMHHGIRNHPAYGYHDDVTALFFRKPDGTPWVRFTEDGFFGYSPVTEVGKSLMWTGAPYRRQGMQGLTFYNFYTVWPDGDNRYAGDIASPGDRPPPGGYVDLTCGIEPVPQITSFTLGEVPKFQPGQQSGRYSVPDGACRK